jgi:DNA-cytosine methyltransferase
MNVLSLFDGISCGQVALKRAGFKINNYFASEIDKYAIKVTQHNHPETIQLGDVTNWREWDLPPIDLIIGGSPCQGFSFAGKQLNFEDPRSKLFFDFVDIVNHFKPKYFLLENVVMKQEYQDIITDYLGVKPIVINSSLVSAQNRKRIYWTNIENINQPKDLSLTMDDILEKGEVAENLYYHVGADYTGKETGHVANLHIKINESEKRVYSSNYKSPTLTTMQGGNRQPKVLIGNIHGSHIMRRLTPLECERLQTLPDNYTNIVSNSQRYKGIGNGWTVAVIEHIFKNME